MHSCTHVKCSFSRRDKNDYCRKNAHECVGDVSANCTTHTRVTISSLAVNNPIDTKKTLIAASVRFIGDAPSPFSSLTTAEFNDKL